MTVYRNLITDIFFDISNSLWKKFPLYELQEYMKY